MRITDILVLIWIMQLSLFVYAAVSGIIPQDYGASIHDFLGHREFIIAIVMFGLIGYLFGGLLIGVTLLILSAISIYTYGYILFYMVSMGSLLRLILGETVTPLVEWSINIVFYIVTIMGLKKTARRILSKIG